MSSAEPISSDPVIVNRPVDESAVLNETKAVLEEPDIESRLLVIENALLAQKLDKTSRSRSPSPRPRFRSRSRSRSPVYRRRVYHSPVRPEEQPIATSSTSLLTILNKTPQVPDTLVDIQSGTGRCNTHMVYLTALPTHQTDLEKMSWIFELGVEDSWVQKPVNFVGRDSWNYDLPSNSNAFTRRGRRVDYIDKEWEEQRFDRGQVPVVRMGTIFTAIFSGETEESAAVTNDEGKVKFITVLQARGNAGWAKMFISHSRAAALVDIFHEIVNGFSIVFVGAVLKDAEIPVSLRGFHPRLAGSVSYKRVGSVQEAEEVDEGVIGVIC